MVVGGAVDGEGRPAVRSTKCELRGGTVAASRSQVLDVDRGRGAGTNSPAVVAREVGGGGDTQKGTLGPSS